MTSAKSSSSTGVRIPLCRLLLVPFKYRSNVLFVTSGQLPGLLLRTFLAPMLCSRAYNFAASSCLSKPDVEFLRPCDLEISLARVGPGAQHPGYLVRTLPASKGCDPAGRGCVFAVLDLGQAALALMRLARSLGWSGGCAWPRDRGRNGSRRSAPSVQSRQSCRGRAPV
jgi:hypothetical protein